MFGSALHQFMNSVSDSVSGFVGGSPNAAAPAVCSSNDAAEPSSSRSPPLSLSHSPSRISHRARVKSPTSPQRKEVASIDLEKNPDSPNSGRMRAVFNETERTPGKTKSGATPLPDPRYHFQDQRRNIPSGKPGASHAPQPRNTLNQQVYRPAQRAPRTYGQPSRTRCLSFPEEDEQFSSNTRPLKKRRTAYEEQFATGIWDAEDIKEIMEEEYTSRPESRLSAGSGHISLSGSQAPQSEFRRTSAVSDPHRKKARSTKAKATTGDAPSAPITVEDDEPIQNTEARRMQLSGFQQGIEESGGSSNSRRMSEVTSSYFPPKMNRLTHLAGSPSHTTTKEWESLPGKLSRAPLPVATKNINKSISTPWRLQWARMHNYEACEDAFLRSGNGYDFSITGTEASDTKSEFTLKKVNRGLSDNQSHVRLTGSADPQGVQYTVDLVFALKDDLHAFLKVLAKKIKTDALRVQAHDYMEKIFDKPLDGPSTLADTTLVPSTREEVPVVTNGEKRPNLIDNLLKDLTGPQKAAKSVGTSVDSKSVRASQRPVRTTRATQVYNLDSGDPKEDLDADKYSQIHGLGPPWTKQLNYGSGRRRAVVDFKDLPRLDNGEFLNDQLIDFYLLYLFDQAKVPSDKVYIFNTHFFTTLTRKVPGQKSINYQGVARWTSKEDIFGYDYIVVPINQDVHWYLAIICNVSNIARAPVIEDLTKSDELDFTASKKSSSELSAGLGSKGGDFKDAVLPSAVVDAKSAQSMPRAEHDVQNAEDSDLDIVDGHATKPEAQLNGSGKTRTVESPIEETSEFKKLSLSDNRPEGILRGGTSPMSSPKRTKRKHGPPPRKCDVSQPVIIVLDSLGGTAKSPTVRVLKEYILQEGQEKRGMDARIHQNAYYAKDSQIPQQQNFSDCGVYLLGYAQKFFEDPDNFKNRLLSGEMQVDTDWPNMVMPTMRNRMRDILQRLYDEQDAERVQTRKNNKKATAGTAKKITGSPDHQTLTVGDKETHRAKEVFKRAATDTEETGPLLEEKSMILPDPHSQLRLASPFESRPPQKRSRSRSLSVITPTESKRSSAPKLGSPEASEMKHHEISLNANDHHRRTSQMASVMSPRKKSSPKQTPRQLLARIGIDEEHSKKRRLEAELANISEYFHQGLQDASEPRIVGIRSPNPMIESVTNRRSKPALSTSPSREVSRLGRGSSHDPISIHDSQELSTSTRARQSSAEPQLHVTSPKARRSVEVNKATPGRQRKQHASSPAKLDNRSSPSTRRRLPYNSDAYPQQQDNQDSYTHTGRGSGSSRWRRATPEEDRLDETIEVPETPPRK